MDRGCTELICFRVSVIVLGRNPPVFGRNSATYSLSLQRLRWPGRCWGQTASEAMAVVDCQQDPAATYLKSS